MQPIKTERKEEDGAIVVAENEAYHVWDDKTDETDDTAAGYGGGNQYRGNDEHA